MFRMFNEMLISVKLSISKTFYDPNHQYLPNPISQ